MEADDRQLDELTKQVRQVIDGNRKFLDKLLDDEFEPEEEELEEEPELVEEL
jgi:hypothetical protein